MAGRESPGKVCGYISYLLIIFKTIFVQSIISDRLYMDDYGQNSYLGLRDGFISLSLDIFR